MLVVLVLGLGATATWMVGAWGTAGLIWLGAGSKAPILAAVGCGLGLTIPPLWGALRLLRATAAAKPHRPTVTLSLLGLWSATLVSVLLLAVGPRTGAVLQQHGDWWLFDRGPSLAPVLDRVASVLAAPATAEAVTAADGAALALDTGVSVDAPAEPMSAKEVFEARADSVVLVRVQGAPKGMLASLMPWVDGHGSGFVVSSEGLIVTNHHVIDGAVRARVEFRDGSHATPILLAEDKGNDLALLKVDAVPAVAPLAAASAEVGDAAIAIGAPLGMAFTLTEGIVGGARNMGGTAFLQMQTPVAPGSSGGPLFDDRGRVVGVNTAVQGPGMNLAVDVSHVRKLLQRDREEVALDTLQPTAEVLDLGLQTGTMHPTTEETARSILVAVARGLQQCVEGVAVAEGTTVSVSDTGSTSEALPSEVTGCLDGKLRMLPLWALPSILEVEQADVLTASIHGIPDAPVIGLRVPLQP